MVPEVLSSVLGRKCVNSVRQASCVLCPSRTLALSSTCWKWLPKSVTTKLKSEKRENVATVPNFLCLSRIALTPFIVVSLINENHSCALSLFFIAGGSDLLDGFIARAFPSQRSNFGSILDPLADKLLVGFVFVALCSLNHLPVYLAVFTIMKDLMLLTGACRVRMKTLPSKIPFSWKAFFDPTLSTVTVTPTTTGKINTGMQLLLITSTMFHLVWPEYVEQFYLTGLSLFTAVTTVVTSIQYLVAMAKEDVI
ncbi:probable cardiolipin synthase (CMP-forming) [Symsagittifera roscoffensis]|uniref:probable cardiolipin synthase (CMP-forming) n=1 Tax=Symsagittifera roscoffensis TaxID=84072 RepID=UPI00307BD7CC